MSNKQDRKTQRLFDNVTKSLLTKNNGLKRDPETGVLYEESLKDEHPGLDLALMYAQPGNIIAKTLAPSMAKGMVEGIRNGDTQQALLSMLVPEEFKGVELLADPKHFSTSRIKLKTSSAEFGPTIMRDGELPLVKWYGPTMGKTYAAKVNKRLIDFDDVIREEKNNLSKKLGFNNVRDMQMSKDPNVQKAYKDLLIAKIKEFKGNPSNSGKTMVVSNHTLVNEPLFDNIPSIPSKNEFVTRSIRRGDTAENAKDWWTNLMKSNPNLKIDDRFVAEIEPFKQGGILKAQGGVTFYIKGSKPEAKQAKDDKINIISQESPFMMGPIPSKESFNSWWLSNRRNKLNLMDYAYHKERDLYPETVDKLKSLQYKYEPINDLQHIGRNKDFPEDSKIGGYYDYFDHTIHLPSDRNYPNAYVHETAHGAFSTPQAIQIDNLLDPKYNNSYFDDPSEINSRLMEVRFMNKFDPSHVFTEEEVEDLKKNPNIWDNNFLNRYDTKTLVRLLNEVAFNNSVKPNLIQYSNRGGTIKAQPGKQLIDRINKTSNANFVSRLKDPNRQVIKLGPGKIGTHLIGYITEDDYAIVFPQIQEVNGKLRKLPIKKAIKRAISAGDTLHMTVPEAEWFTTNYKQYYPNFDEK